jgi:hypothetical protein
MNVKGERVSLPVVPMSYRNLSGDAEKAHVGVDQLLLAGWLAMVCVCVCESERERERERGLYLGLTYLKPELLPCPLRVLSKCRVYWVPFQVHICF